MGCRSHVPGWHERTKELRESGKVRFVGIIQEQHPDRCRLFMKWKRMDWPILVDSLDLLGVSAVPITIFLDEHGVIRDSRLKPDELSDLLEREFPAPESSARTVKAIEAGSAADWLARGDTHFIEGGDARLSNAVDAYRKAIALDGPPEAEFRLGVALRRRFESSSREPGDFQGAVAAWGRALARRPNQYIWRRRIQQYGPRLGKPYAFYDWVKQARSDIVARGETPPALRVEPGGAEIAHPDKSFDADSTSVEPDPEGKIARDVAATPKAGAALIEIESATAPAVVEPGRTLRAHVALLPSAKRKAHWNNESPPLVVWIDPPPGVEIDQRRLTAPNAKTPSSHERRGVEFELRIAKSARKGESLRVPGYALYSVCEDVDGVCRYLRQDFAIEVRVKG